MNLSSLLTTVDLHLDKRQFQLALDVCNLIIESYPEDFRGYHKRSKVYARFQNWQSALDDIDIVIGYKSNEPAHYFSKARWELELEDYSSAVFSFKKVIELENYFNDQYYLESTYFYLAIVSFYLNNPADVKEFCSKVREDFSLPFKDKLFSRVSLMSWASGSG